MARETASLRTPALSDRSSPYSEEAERGVLGSILLDPENVLDLCVERQLTRESFLVPAHREIFGTFLDMSTQGTVIDVVTAAERLDAAGKIDQVGGAVYLEQLIDSTPTAAHAEYYIDIVRQKHVLRCVIECAREAENRCYESEESADVILDKTEQSFFDITERQHGFMVPWPDAVKETMAQVESILDTKQGITGVATGLANLDRVLQGLKPGEMTIIAARPSMGKTSLAMNIAENVALGTGKTRQAPTSVGIFSLEMAQETLVMRMLCSHAGVSSFKLLGGYVSQDSAHVKLTKAASALTKAPIYLDDTGGLDVMEVRARARRMKKKYDVQLLVIDYLQLLHASEMASQGRQLETAYISGNLKAMAKELRLPVVVLSQLSRAPEQRDRGRPRLSDLRDSGAIEQDADVVCLLRRPCKYEDEDQQRREDTMLAIVEVAKHRNGPTGEVHLNFEEEFTRFRDRETGVDGVDDVVQFLAEEDEQGPTEEPLP